MADYSVVFEMAIRAGQYLEQMKIQGMILELKSAALAGQAAAIAAGAIPVLAWGGVWAALGAELSRRTQSSRKREFCARLFAGFRYGTA